MVEDTDITFEEILSRAQVESERDNSIIEEAKALTSAVYFEEETDIVDEARNKLMKENPQKLYLECLKSLISKMNSASKAEKFIWASAINDLALQGLGIKIDDFSIKSNDLQQITLSNPKWNNIEKHINDVVIGDYFIYSMSIPPDSEIWGEEFPLKISACDASQHRFKFSAPRTSISSPVVVNNAAGIIKTGFSGQNHKWENITVPRDTKDFENWVIVGYKDYTELNDVDYIWSTKSAMDVGQFYVEENWIFQSRGIKYKPDIHFRDGRIFPQDHAENSGITNRRGELTREAILRMNSAIQKAKDLDVIYCGVAKRTQLKVWSVIIDWYITDKMGESRWNKTRHILTDTEVMKRFLYTNGFNSQTFDKILVTVPILRSYYTTSNLNRRTDNQVQNDLNRLSKIKHNRNITAADIIKRALDLKVAMFFAGHTKTTELYIPRYEFVCNDTSKKGVEDSISKILSGLRLASFDIDKEHLWGLETPIPNLLPVPIIIADKLSRKMGEELSRNWKSKVIQEIIKIRNNTS